MSTRLRTVNARLRTLCGCEKIVSIPAPAPAVHEEPIVVRLPMTNWGKPIGDAPVTRYRKFKLKSFQPLDVAVDADYEEVPE